VSRLFPDLAGEQIAAAAAILSSAQIALAQTRGRARDLTAAAAELLTELAAQGAWLSGPDGTDLPLIYGAAAVTSSKVAAPS